MEEKENQSTADSPPTTATQEPVVTDPQPTVESPLTDEPKEKKNFAFLEHKVFIAFLIILALITTGALVYLYIQNQSLKKEMSQPVLTPTPTTLPDTPTPTPDSTVDWETYRNEELGFEIKHPENYQVEVEDNSSVKIFSPKIQCETGATGLLTKTQVSEVEIVIVLHENKTFKNAWHDAFGFEFKGENTYDGTSLVDGKTAYFFYASAEMALAKTAYMVEGSENSVYEINIYTPNLISNCDEPFNMFPKDGDQILSTFRFLDKADMKEQSVQITTDKLSYAANNTIEATVTNGSGSSITAFDQKSYCTILTLERQTENEWKPVVNCVVGRPFATTTIKPNF